MLLFILEIVLGIALVLLILLFTLLFILFFCKTTIYVSRDDKQNTRVSLKIFFVRIKLYPIGKTKEKSYKPQKTEKEPKSDEQSEEKDDFSSKYMDLILNIIYDLKEKLYIDKLYLNIIFASDDAAKTGIMLGTAFSICGMITPILRKGFHLKNQSIILDADFDSNKTKFTLDFIGHTRIIKILLIAFKYRKQLFKIYQKTE